MCAESGPSTMDGGASGPRRHSRTALAAAPASSGDRDAQRGRNSRKKQEKAPSSSGRCIRGDGRGALRPPRARFRRRGRKGAKGLGPAMERPSFRAILRRGRGRENKAGRALKARPRPFRDVPPCSANAGQERAERHGPRPTRPCRRGRISDGATTIRRPPAKTPATRQATGSVRRKDPAPPGALVQRSLAAAPDRGFKRSAAVSCSSHGNRPAKHRCRLLARR